MISVRHLIATVILLTHAGPVFADEGMYPISEIHKINLKSKGLKLKTSDIYNPDDVSWIHAIVSLGFCTGSFVSDQGLILTNHHCAFGAVQSASSTANDYIRDGFLARSLEEEIPAKDYTVRITETYQDVTPVIMKDISDTMDALSRAHAISENMRAAADNARKQNPDMQVEIMEMLPGKSYVIFYYTLLKDIRLVYVPPRSIGEFGGEEDNWVWPRHTGDFAFIRAYVSKEGKAAAYSKDNVPYKPKKFLRIAAQGVSENDFVFILGYPGRTFRHRPAEYIAYEQDVRMPYLAGLMEWQIRTMEQMSRQDHAVSIKLAQRIKSLANTSKNYRGKLKSMKAIDLVQKRRDEEKALWAYIDKDPSRKVRYGSLKNDIETQSALIRKSGEYEFVLDYFRRSVYLIDMGYAVIDAMFELQKPDQDRRTLYKDENRPSLISHIRGKLFNYHEPADKLFFADLLKRTGQLPAGNRFAYADRLLTRHSPDEIADQLYGQTNLSKDSLWLDYLKTKPSEIASLKDPMMDFIFEYYKLSQNFRAEQDEQNAILNKLFADLIDIRSRFLQKNFIPDANRTLRFTFGYIRGYSPADALHCAPLTTLKGILEKTTGEEPFDTPAKLINLIRKRTFGKYKDKKLNDVPVAMLYNTDTTGGNSGSPVMNAKGEIVGLNFDRAFEATINDFAWNESYSRSIGVDIRYILWVLDHFAGAQNVLNELKV